MTLAVERGVDIQVARRSDAIAPSPTNPLVVRLAPGGILINDQPVPADQLLQGVKGYFAKNPQGTAILQADPDVSYEQTVQLLGELKLIGGDRISLAID